MGASLKQSHFAVAVAVFLVAAAAFLWALPLPLPVHDNTVRDLLLAQECLRGDGCPLEGQSAAFGGLYQGGMWKLVLAALQALGLGPDGAARLIALLAALAVVVTFLVGRSLMGETAGLVAAALLILGLGLNPTVLNILWNPSLLPLPTALLLACGIGAARTRSTGAWLGLGLATSLTLQSHVIALVWLPAILVLAHHRPPARRLAAWGGGAALFLGSLAAFSLHALIRSGQGLAAYLASGGGPDTPGAGDGAWFSALFGVALVPGGLLWRFSGRLDEPRRAAVRSLVLLVVGSLGLLLAGALITGWRFVPQYPVAFLPGLALLLGGAAGLAAVRPSLVHSGSPSARRALTGLAVLLLLVAALVTATRKKVPAITRHTYRDAQIVAEILPELGLETLAEARLRLRSPQRFFLLSALELHLPPGDREAAAAGLHKDPTLLFLIPSSTAPPTAPPSSWRVVPSARAGQWLYLVPRTPVLCWEGARATVLSGVARGGAVTRNLSGASDQTCARPGYPAGTGMCAVEPLRSMRVSVPLCNPTTAPGNASAGLGAAGDAPTLPARLRPHLAAPAPGDSVQVTAATGVSLDRELPAREVILDTGAPAGAVEFTWDFAPPGRMDLLALPLVLELSTDDALLARVVEGMD